MGSDVVMEVVEARAKEPETDRTLSVALGRRAEVIGDLLLPLEPTDSSRAACRDIGRRLEEWQGPGIVILCGRLVAPGCRAGAPSARALGSHPELTAALGTFAGRDDSQVVAVMAAERDPELVQALERCGKGIRHPDSLPHNRGGGLVGAVVVLSDGPGASLAPATAGRPVCRRCGRARPTGASARP